MARKATKTKAETAETEAPKATRRTAPAKTARAEKPASSAKAGAARKPGPTSAEAPPAGRAGKPKAAAKATAKLAAKVTPAVEALTAPVARGSAKAKKAMKTAKDQARALIPDAPNPASSSLPAPVVDTVKAIGNQIVGALSSDVGRVMVAELLVYVAKSLTTAAAKTEAAGDAKSAILNAGAKLGAVAADAGAKLVDTGNAAASGGAKLVENGKDAAEAGMDAAAKGASNASDIMREVAHVAVGAVGGVVADTAAKFMKGRGKKGDAATAKLADMTKSTGPKNVL